MEAFIDPPPWVQDALKRSVWKYWDVEMSKRSKDAFTNFWIKCIMADRKEKENK